jgi:hypothetical protein
VEILWLDGWQVVDVNGRIVHAQERQVRGLISAHLGQDFANFFATPSTGTDGALSWRTVDGRALSPLGRHPASKRLAETGAERIAKIEALAGRLEKQGDAGRLAAHTLRSALVTPEGAEALYTDGEGPILALWGVAAPGQARPEPPTFGAAAAAVMSGAGVAAMPGDAAATTPDGRETRENAGGGRTHRPPLWPWAVPLALAATALVLFWQAILPPPPTIVEIIPPAPPASDPTAGLGERLEALSRAIAEADAALPRFAAVCVAPVPVPDPEAASNCPSGQIAKLPSELMLVLDASGSMKFSIATPPELERDLVAALNRDQARFRKITAQVLRIPGEQRMTVARDILKDAISAAPPGMPIGLTSFHTCQRIRAHGVFANAERGRLYRALDQIKPTGGTALARAIVKAANEMSGGLSEDDPVNMVLISDGLDVCGGDPCAEARKAKRTRPGLVINVIDLSDHKALSCVARTTGGIYMRRDEMMDIDDLSRATRDAAGITSGTCVPAAVEPD